MSREWAGLAAVVLAAGVAVALPATLIIVALGNRPSPADAELIGVIATLAAAAIGAVGGYLARHGPTDELTGTGSNKLLV